MIDGCWIWYVGFLCLSLSWIVFTLAFGYCSWICVDGLVCVYLFCLGYFGFCALVVLRLFCLVFEFWFELRVVVV